MVFFGAEDTESVVSSFTAQGAKHLALAGPFGRQAGETGNSHAVREPSINGRLDEVGREEGERDCHVDLPLGAT